MSTTMEAKHLFSSKDAENCIKRAPTGSKFCIQVRNDGPDAAGNLLILSICGHVKVTKGEALRFVENCLNHVDESRGALIPITIVQWKSAFGKELRTYWIGA